MTTIPKNAIAVEVIEAQTPESILAIGQDPHKLILTRYQYYIASGDYEYIKVWRLDN